MVRQHEITCEAGIPKVGLDVSSGPCPSLAPPLGIRSPYRELKEGICAGRVEWLIH